MTLTTLALTESVKAHALALGFDRVAVRGMAELPKGLFHDE